MKITDKLTVEERILAGILISLLLMMGAITAVVSGVIVLTEFISWKSLLVLIPFISFIVLMAIYTIMIDRKIENHDK